MLLRQVAKGGSGGDAAATLASVAGSSERDLRIDFFRGLALAGIAANHTLPPPALARDLPQYAFGHWFAFDFADVFVFLSGLAAARAYGRRARHDFAAAQAKAFQRGLTIWFAGLVATAGVLVWMMTLALLTPAYEVNPALAFDAAALTEPGDWLTVLTLGTGLGLLGILRFYALVVPLVPAAVWLFDRSRPAAWLLCLSPYAIVTATDLLGGGAWPASVRLGGSLGNPLAWQLLFFGGLLLGLEHRRRGGFRLTGAWSTAGLTIALLVLIGGDFLRQMRWIHFHLVGKDNLGPLRVLELLAAVIIVSTVVGPRAAVWRRPPLSWITRAGRHGLPLFVAGVIVSYVLTHVGALVDVGRPGYLASVVGAAAVVVGLGLWLERRRQRALSQTSPTRAECIELDLSARRAAPSGGAEGRTA